MTDVTISDVSAATTMRDLLVEYPGAQRALFAKYHIGGCQSCGFRPDETVGEVCRRNENLPVDEVLAHVRDCHEADSAIRIEPEQLRARLNGQSPPKLVDIRTREEFEAVKIPGAIFFTQELLGEIFASWGTDSPIVVYDHGGDRSIDAAAYLVGHGFGNVKSLRGGIDAYSREADPSLPRYKVEID